MRLQLAIPILAAGGCSGFAPGVSHRAVSASTSLKGYLDDLTSELYGPDSNPNPEEESREATKLDKSKISNFGVGSFEDYVVSVDVVVTVRDSSIVKVWHLISLGSPSYYSQDFGDEFDGGDGQMGVAGDGNKGLEKMDGGPQIASRSMSAKNAWGTSTGYADELVNKNPSMDTARAQQLENWANQQEVRMKNQQLKSMAETFDQDQSSEEENWRQLANFGVERVTDTDLDEEFGAVTAGDIEGVIELKSTINRVVVHDMYLKNPYMGFADFRATFTPETPSDWTVEPTEGALKQKEETHFLVKFRPQGPGTIQGYLVIETEDFKKTWQVVGST